MGETAEGVVNKQGKPHCPRLRFPCPSESLSFVHGSAFQSRRSGDIHHNLHPTGEKTPVFQWVSMDPKTGVVTADVESRVMECGPGCPEDAGADGCCAGHPSRWGLRWRLYVSHDPDDVQERGWAVFTLERIPKHSVIMPYLGEVKVDAEDEEGGKGGYTGEERKRESRCLCLGRAQRQHLDCTWQRISSRNEHLDESFASELQLLSGCAGQGAACRLPSTWWMR